jgi:hypothetical protein
LKAPTLEQDGWRLVSAEERHAAAPTTFELPSIEQRANLSPGDAAKLLFEIAARENGTVVDQGIDRMWVIVRRSSPAGYVGVLDNDPGVSDGLNLRRGLEICFSAQHVCSIATPPREYVEATYGPDFFADSQ